MTSIRVQDRALLTATELALVESSESSRIRAYTAAQLNNRIVRARRFWDKYRKLAREQQRTTKTSGKRGRLHASPNVRTERKAQVFARALERFEKRLEQLTREVRRRPRMQAKPASKNRPGSIKPRKTIGRKRQQGQTSDEAARTTRITRRFQKSKTRAIQGHIKARGKRSQAKRDARH
ncbi:MAG: hypothetical protein OEY28_10695 [Nitrospira sp.]|nr:hypothetical protein [Nitrospira sp.]